LELLDEIEQVPAVAVGHRHHRLPSLIVDRKRSPHGLFGTFDERGQRLLVEASEDEHLAAGEEYGVAIEAEVLRRRADEHHCAVLHIGKEGILLSTVEAVDLIDEQHRALTDLSAFGSRLEDSSEFGDSGEGR